MRRTEPQEHIIVLEDVTKTYQMGKVEAHALRGVDLVVQRGDFMEGTSKMKNEHDEGTMACPREVLK